MGQLAFPAKTQLANVWRQFVVKIRPDSVHDYHRPVPLA